MNLSHRHSFGPFVFLVFVFALAYAVVLGPSWWWAISYAIHFFIFSFGISFGLHRLVAHRAGPVPDWIRNFAAIIGVLGQVGSPLGWRTMHVLHHIHADSTEDPHSPKYLGMRVILNLNTPLTKERFVEGLLAGAPLNDPFLMFLHRYYYLVTAVFLTACFVLFGTNGLVFIGLLPIGLSFFSIGLLNYFTHLDFGYQNFKVRDHSRNIWWMWPLTYGENWHNNHHQNSREPCFRVRFFEIDVAHFYFLLAKHLGKKAMAKTDSELMSPTRLTPPQTRNL